MKAGTSCAEREVETPRRAKAGITKARSRLFFQGRDRRRSVEQAAPRHRHRGDMYRGPDRDDDEKTKHRGQGRKSEIASRKNTEKEAVHHFGAGWAGRGCISTGGDRESGIWISLSAAIGCLLSASRGGKDPAGRDCCPVGVHVCCLQ